MVMRPLTDRRRLHPDPEHIGVGVDILILYKYGSGRNVLLQFTMVSLTAALQTLLVLALLLTVIQGMEEGGRDTRSVSNNFGRSPWNQGGHISVNEMINGDEAMADLLKVNPWTYYPNQGKLTFERESRNLANFQSRSGRDEESQFTETSRSPPFAPRLGRVLHYSPRFRRITLN